MAAPLFVQGLPPETRATDGDIVTFQACVSGQPEPDVTWLWCGEPVVPGGRGCWEVSKHPGGWHQLVLSNVHEEDEGEFECRAENCHGQVSTFGDLYYYKEGAGDTSTEEYSAGEYQVTGGSRTSALLILIDDGSQTDEDQQGAVGRKKSLTASEQIQGIIEDLTQQDIEDDEDSTLRQDFGSEGEITDEIYQDAEYIETPLSKNENGDYPTTSSEETTPDQPQWPEGDGGELRGIMSDDTLVITRPTLLNQVSHLTSASCDPATMAYRFGNLKEDEKYLSRSTYREASRYGSSQEPSPLTSSSPKGDDHSSLFVDRHYNRSPESTSHLSSLLSKESTDFSTRQSSRISRVLSDDAETRTSSKRSRLIEESEQELYACIKGSSKERKTSRDSEPSPFSLRHSAESGLPSPYEKYSSYSRDSAENRSSEYRSKYARTESQNSEVSQRLSKDSQDEGLSGKTSSLYSKASTRDSDFGRSNSREDSRYEKLNQELEELYSKTRKASKALEEKLEGGAFTFPAEMSEPPKKEQQPNVSAENISPSLPDDGVPSWRSKLAEFSESSLPKEAKDPTFKDVYFAVLDFQPLPCDEGALPLNRGQRVHVLDASRANKWLVELCGADQEESRGFVPACYLEKVMEDPREKEAFDKRQAVVRELVETEEDFSRDMQFVMDNYVKLMDEPTTPKTIKDKKEALFGNFAAIAEFHTKVLIKGVQYNAKDPSQLGKTFLRLERDFDRHVDYCRDEPKAQQLLATDPELKTFIQNHSKSIKDDKTLSEHLKLPIQRINDYQLLLKELIKYTTRLKEDATDLQRALEFMQAIPQRSADLKYVNAMEGFKGNLLKLGRLLLHGKFTVRCPTEADSGPRYLFLFKGRMFVTEVIKKQNKDYYQFRMIVRLPEVETNEDASDKCAIVMRHKNKAHPKFPMTLLAPSQEVRDIWLKELVTSASPQILEDLGEEEPEVVSEEPEAKKPKIEDEGKPKFKKPLRGVTCHEKETAVFEVEVWEPNLSVKWLRNNKPIPKSSRVTMMQSGDRYQLVIREATANDAGMYTAVATTEDGTMVSCTAPLNLRQGLLGVTLPDSRPTTPGGTILPHAPVFKVKLKDTQLLEGTSVRFEIVVRGHPDPKVTFFKDDKILKEDKRTYVLSESNEVHELVIENVKPSDGGTYRCDAENSQGKDSTEGKITITKHKVLFKGLGGDWGRESVERSPTPRPRTPLFKWFKDGSEFEASERFQVAFDEEEDSLALVFQKVTPDDAGLYTCVASTSTGARISCSAELTVQGTVNRLMRTPEPPALKAQLLDTEVSEGASAMLELKYSGYPRPKISWYKDGEAISLGGRIRFLTEDEESATLVIKGVTRGDSGRYAAVVENELGRQEAKCRLTVTSKPVFRSKLRDMAVMTNEPVRFEVEVEATPEPEIKWYKDGQELTESDRIKLLHDQAEIFALLIEKAVPADSGQYACVVSNEFGSETATSQLVVTEPPRFDSGLPETSSGTLGKPMELAVRIAGTPAPSVTWLKDGKEIKPDGKRIKLEEDKDGKHRLLINKLEEGDQGTYACRLANDHGKAETKGKLLLTSPPKFTKALNDAEVISGDDVELSVQVEGCPSPSIKWRKDNKILEKGAKNIVLIGDESTGGKFSLKLTQVKPEDAGKYSCEAQNASGKAVTQALLAVKVKETKPTIPEGLRSKELVAGSPGSLEARVQGEPTPEVTWFKDGKPIKDAQTKRGENGTVALVFPSVTEADAGQYTLKAENPLGVTESSAAITVIGEDASREPLFEVKLKPTQWEEGKSGVLEAKVSGKPTPCIKWTKNGEELKPNNKIQISQDPDGTIRLCLDDVKPEDAGQYAVIVSNDKGEIKSEVPVTVKPLALPKKSEVPAFISGLQSGELEVGKPLTLEAKVEGKINNVKWLHNGKEIDSNFAKLSQSPDGILKLEIDKAGLTDGGSYELIVGNESGEAGSTATVTLKGMPSFAKPLQDVHVLEGEPIKMVAEVAGEPFPQVEWFMNGEPLPTSEDVIQRIEGRKAILEIPKPNEAQISGSFECKLTSPSGSESSKARAHLVEKAEAPIFIKRLSDKEGTIGRAFELECQVTGTPEPSVTWYFKDSPIASGTRYTVDKSGEMCTLVMMKPSLLDSGVYACKAENAGGEASTSAQVTFREVPAKGEAPVFLKKIGDTEVPISGTARFTACLHGEPTPTIEWFVDGEPLVTDIRRRWELESTGVLRMTVRDVDAADVGEYRVVATNALGQASCSATLRLDTLEDRPFSPMADQFIDYDKFKKSGVPVPLADRPTIVRMDDVSATIAWRPSVPHKPRLPVTYQLEWCPHPDGEWTPYLSGIKDTTCDVHGLQPSQDYRFRVRVENKHGISEPSPYAIAHRAKLQEKPSVPREFSPTDFDIIHPPLIKPGEAPRFLRKEEAIMYGVKGQPVSIEFWVYGNPEPEITWSFKGEKIGRDKYDFLQDRNGKVAVYISQMNDSDVGTYTCLAVNEFGKASKDIELRVAESPYFTLRLEPCTALQRRTARLECRVEGLPYPNIRWYKDWFPLYDTGRVKILWEKPDHCILCLSDTILRDTGLYSCSATNIAGTATSSALLSVEESDAKYDTKTYAYPKVVRPKTKAFEEFYDIGDELGRGTQGIVYHVVERETGQSFAAKTMDGKGQPFQGYMAAELEAMGQLCHPRLVRLWDAFRPGTTGLTLVTDLCGGGEVLQTILSRGSLTERQVAHYIAQVLEGLQHMHHNHFGHLGLTIGDILLSRLDGDDVKIGDFGLATKLIKGTDFIQEFGHPEYVAPELANKQPATFASDMWSVGIITYVLLSGVSPFLGDNDRETLTRVQKGEITFPAELFQDITPEGKDFMSKLLVYDPNGRMKVNEALEHPWIQGFLKKYEGGKPLGNLERLKDYYKKWRKWYDNASCKRHYRRRTLESCFHHPSKMIYPPGEVYTPARSPEPEGLRRTSVKPSQFEESFQQKVSRETIDVSSESRYQNGPDTYLLQHRDPGFPARIREYLRVGAHHSPSLAQSLREEHWGDSSVVVRERRKFVDIMDEEIQDEWAGRTLRTVPIRLYHEVGSLGFAHEQMEQLRHEVWKEKPDYEVESGVAPFFREKIRDTTVLEGSVATFRCLAVGNPDPYCTWFRNDGVLIESKRVQMRTTKAGRFELKIEPVQGYDAGVYKCVARNSHGGAICHARLKLGDIPGAPSPPNVEATSESEVSLVWEVPRRDGNAPILAYDLERLSQGEEEWTSVASNFSHEFFVVRNLAPSTVYQFRIRARNKFGLSIWSQPSEQAATLESGTGSRLKVIKARKYMQEMTEKGQGLYNPEDEGRSSEPDYTREEKPIQPENRDPLDVFKLVAEVAKGRFGAVLQVWVKETGEVKTAKIVVTGDASEGHGAKEEVDILGRICHERIVQLHAVYQHQNLTVFLMEKLSGLDVMAYLTMRSSYSEETVAKILHQVLDALEYLHHRDICYLEMQPDNVVLEEDWKAEPNVKLVDFGSARIVSKMGGKVSLAATPNNTEFLAPEVILGEQVHTSSDVWTVGILTYILLSGISPFRGSTPEETRSNVTFVQWKFENLMKEATVEASRFLMLIFKRCPLKRPTVEECLENKWLMPTEFMLRKREAAIFDSERLRNYARQFRAQKETEICHKLLESFEMSLSKSLVLEAETLEEF